MENATQKDAPKAPRGWLWLARCALAFFFIASLLMAVAILVLFLEGASGHWDEWRTLLWFTVCIAALSCGLIPYILVAWNRWRERTRAKGLSQAIIIGNFWFFVGWILPADLSFHGAPGLGPRGVAESHADLLEASLAVFLGCSLPALLLLISGIKLLNFRSASNTAAAAPNACRHEVTLRAGLGTALVLLMFPAALGLFTLGRDLPILYLVPFEAMLLTAAVPYMLVWRNLRKDTFRPPARKALSAMATGLLALFAMGGLTYGIIDWGTSPSQPHRVSTRAELVFFSLLALANVGVLLAGRSHGREAGKEKQFNWGALAISFCLVVFGFFVMLASAST